MATEFPFEPEPVTEDALPDREHSELLIAGDSHVRALGIPLSSHDENHHLARVNSAIYGIVGPWPRRFDEYWDAVEAHAPGRAVAICWGGNRHLSNYLFAPTPLFDFVVAEEPGLPLDESVQIIPEEAMRAFLAPPIRQIEKRVTLLRELAVEVLIPGSPPPKEDDAFIRSRFAKEPHFGRMAEKLGIALDDVPLSPGLLRLKMWMALQGVLSDMAERTGSTFVPVPPAARSETGFLHPSCYADDVTHANARFGKLMLEELLAASAARH